MSQILSQEEIDALLGGLDDVEGAGEEKASGEKAEAMGEVVPYDFLHFTKKIRVKFPAFDVINDQFNRGLRTTLSSILRIVVDSAVVPTETLTFKEFLRRVPVPSNIHILKMEPLRGHFMMVVDPQLVFCIVEIFLGSNRVGQARIEGREFTSIEQRLIRRISNSVLADLERAWQPVHPVNIQYVRSEINPQFAKIAQPDDSVIINKYQLDLEEISGAITICIPINMLHPIKSKLQTAFQGEEAEDPAWKQGILENIKRTDVEIIVPLGRARIRGAELLDLNVGDIIQLNTGIDDLLPVQVQGRPKFAATAGLYKGQRAVKVEYPVEDVDVF